MPSLLQSYEQHYSVLTADITAKIGRLKSSNEGENINQLSKEILSNFEEAKDLLEQLELECRDAGAGIRMAAYRAELERVRKEFYSVSDNSSVYEIDPEDVYDEWSGASEQHRKLLDNSERLERQGRALGDGYSAALDAERAGAAVLRDLAAQRDTLQRARGRLHETDEQLDRSSRLMVSMVSQAMQERFVLALVLLVLTAAGAGAFAFFS